MDEAMDVQVTAQNVCFYLRDCILLGWKTIINIEEKRLRGISVNEQSIRLVVYM